MKIFELNEADITTGKLVDVKPGAEATIDMGDGTKTIVDLKKNPTALVKSPDGKTMFNKAGMTSGGVQPEQPDPTKMFKPGEPVTITTTQTEAVDDINDTFYFFDVARGGHSFREQDLTAMGLKRSRSGKWYYRPRRSESSTSLRSKLDRLEKILNIKAKTWKPELQEFSGNFTGGGPIGPAESQEPMDENLRKWFKEKWVRFGPDGKIRGECGGRDDSEGKPKCLPASKAHALGKKGRASAGARKRREDPNPERSGPAINVATKKNEGELNEKWSEKYKRSIDCDNPRGFSQRAHCQGRSKSNEAQEQLDEKCWDTHKQVGMKNKGGRMVPNCVPKEGAPVNSKKSYLDSEPYNPPRDAQGRSYLDPAPYNPPRDAQGRSYLDFDPMQSQLDPSGKSYFDEGHQMCPECGGAMYEVSMMNEKKDACYYKVKSRYKVWPSAYASGALVKCRKKGAKNWGSKSESMHEGGFDIPEIPRAPQPKPVPAKGQGIEEAGPFSYGVKKPRKGSVADLAAKKRKEQEKGKQPVEPRDQRVGVARVVKELDVKGASAGDKAAYDQYAQVRAKGDILDREASETPSPVSFAGSTQSGFNQDTRPHTKVHQSQLSKDLIAAQTTGLAAQNPEMEKRYTMNKLAVKPTKTNAEIAAQLESQGMAEGFDELVKFINDKYGPQPRGGSGIKLGKYGRAGEKSRGRPIGPTGGHGSDIPRNVDFDRPHSERSAGRRIPRFSDDYDSIRRSDMDEASTREKLHRRHQELRKKSGLPDPNYYKEMLATYDLDDRERLARQAEIKKKYRVNK